MNYNILGSLLLGFGILLTVKEIELEPKQLHDPKLRAQFKSEVYLTPKKGQKIIETLKKEGFSKDRFQSLLRENLEVFR